MLAFFIKKVKKEASWCYFTGKYYEEESYWVCWAKCETFGNEIILCSRDELEELKDYYIKNYGKESRYTVFDFTGLKV